MVRPVARVPSHLWREIRYKELLAIAEGWRFLGKRRKWLKALRKAESFRLSEMVWWI